MMDYVNFAFGAAAALCILFLLIRVQELSERLTQLSGDVNGIDRQLDNQHNKLVSIAEAAGLEYVQPEPGRWKKAR